MTRAGPSAVVADERHEAVELLRGTRRWPKRGRPRGRRSRARATRHAGEVGHERRPAGASDGCGRGVGPHGALRTAPTADRALGPAGLHHDHARRHRGVEHRRRRPPEADDGRARPDRGTDGSRVARRQDGLRQDERDAAAVRSDERAASGRGTRPPRRRTAHRRGPTGRRGWWPGPAARGRAGCRPPRRTGRQGRACARRRRGSAPGHGAPRRRGGRDVDLDPHQLDVRPPVRAAAAAAARSRPSPQAGSSTRSRRRPSAIAGTTACSTSSAASAGGVYQAPRRLRSERSAGSTPRIMTRAHAPTAVGPLRDPASTLGRHDVALPHVHP